MKLSPFLFTLPLNQSDGPCVRYSSFVRLFQCLLLRLGRRPPREDQTDGQDDPQPVQAYTEIPRTPVSLQLLSPAIVDVRLDGPCHAQTDTDRIIDHGIDQARGQTLMLGRHVVRQDDHAAGETHVHTPRGDDQGDKGLCPKGLMHRHGRQQDVTDTKRRHGDQQYPTWLDLADDEASRDGSDGTGYGGWYDHGRSQEDRLTSQKFQKLP